MEERGRGAGEVKKRKGGELVCEAGEKEKKSRGRKREMKEMDIGPCVGGGLGRESGRGGGQAGSKTTGGPSLVDRGRGTGRKQGRSG